MTSSVHQYLINVNTGVDFPYYPTLQGRNYDIEKLHACELPRGSDYLEIFEPLFKLEKNATNYQHTTAHLLCTVMKDMDKKASKPIELDYFKFKLDEYFKDICVSKYSDDPLESQPRDSTKRKK